MDRNDIHKPSTIVPADYTFVGFNYIGPEPFATSIAEQKILSDHQALTGGEYATHSHGGT